MKYIGFVPCRAGSVRIPDKWKVAVRGKPLYEWTIDAINSTYGLDRCIFSSDSEEFLELCRKKYSGNAVCVLESKISKEAQIEERIIRCYDDHRLRGSDNIVLLQMTSPLRTGVEISYAIKKHAVDMVAISDRSVGLIGVCAFDKFVWRHDGTGTMVPSYNVAKRPRSDTSEHQTVYLENGAIYISPTKSIVRSKSRCGCDVMIPFYMDQRHMVEIDTVNDIDTINNERK